MPYVDHNNSVGGNRRPVVVLIECEYREVGLHLGAESPFNEQIYGDRAHFNQVQGHADSFFRGWCFDPEKPENMLRILADHPRFTLGRARRWLASDGFVRSARQALVEAMCHGQSSTKLFNKNWRDRVRVVVFGSHIDTDSIYVKRVFGNWFPNADFAKYKGVGGYHHYSIFEENIWKDKE